MSPTPTLPAWLADALQALKIGDIESYMTIYASDGVHEFPFAPAGRPQRLQGRDEIAAYMGRLPTLIRFGTMRILSVRELGDELIVEARGSHHRLPDDEPFNLGYVWFITRVSGKVKRFRDYMSPIVAE